MSETRSDAQRRLLHVLAALLLIDLGALCVLGILEQLDLELTGSLLLGALATILALMATGLTRRGGNVIVMGGAITLSYAAWGIAVSLFYYGHRYDFILENLLIRLAWTMAIIAIAIVYHGGMRQFDAKARTVRVIRNGTLLTALVFAIMLLVLIWFGERLFSMGIAGRYVFEFVVTTVTVILGSFTLIGPSVVRHLVQREGKRFDKADAAMDRKAPIEMDCPKCELPLTFAAGPGRCDACGFSCLIELEEPRCECGYLIYEHTSEHCPECGIAIPEADRWVEAAVPEVM